MSQLIAKRTWIAKFALLFLLAGFSCAQANPEAPVVTELESLAADACNCPDSACAESIRSQVKRATSTSEPLEGEDIKAARAAVARISSCMSQAFARSAGENR